MLCEDTDGNQCTVARCEPNTGVCRQNRRADPRQVCPQDGNPCTQPSCNVATGQCGQTAVRSGTACGNPELPEFCPAQTCQEGSCVSTGSGGVVPDPALVANVEVKAQPERVTENEAFNDCCTVCAHQSLEAKRPHPRGPRKADVDGGLPLRRKLCGRVVGLGIGYGVNDESDDPRDILINIEPGPGFEDLTAGMLQNACSKMTGAEEDLFKVSDDSECPIEECRAAALAAAADQDRLRCIHSEVTPPQQFFRQDRLFLPIDSSGPCSASPSEPCVSRLEDPLASIGDVCVYGVYAIDHGEDHRASDHTAPCCLRDSGGHDYMEIHPFDAVWWRHPSLNGWMFAVFQDDSNRYSEPHCGGKDGQDNDNLWSQAPRDVTFRFPFSFPRAQAPLKACLRLARTESFSGVPNAVVPLHVSTDRLSDPMTEAKFLVDGTAVVMEVVERPGAESETQARVDGCVVEQQVQGYVTLRVAVGCTEEMRCTGLRDPEDPGSGFYYGELFFAASCS
jgi:hypothetical protein